MTSRLIRLCTKLLICMTPLGVPAPAAAAPATLAEMRAFDGRVETIGHRLAVAARDLCDAPVWRPGFVLWDLSQFAAAARPDMIRALGLDAGPGVRALATGGPADRAGLRVEDIVLMLDGVLPPSGPSGDGASFDQMERILARVDEAFADGVADIRVRRAGREAEIHVAAERGCPTRFQSVGSANLTARADGRYVQIATAFAAYAPDDTDLAAVLAHEFAHNILGHRARLDAAGVQRGLMGNLGRNARLIRETEEEADRLSVHILDRAGYDLDSAMVFWERFGRRGLNAIGSPTHGNWRTRIARMREEIARIREARAAGQAAVPPFRP